MLWLLIDLSATRTIRVEAQDIPGQRGTDGYADTDAAHPRFSPPEGDPVGDGKGWGPNAAQRATSPAGPQSPNKLFVNVICTKICINDEVS